MSKYQFTDEMSEISGFGGSYEAECRAAIVRGLEWFDANPDADPKFHGFKDVYGIIMEDNDAAKELSAAIAPKGSDMTGAMHQAAVEHCMYIRKNGWEKYVQVKTDQKKEEEAETAV